MLTSEECEQKAAECLRLARVMNDVTHQALLLKMALAWIERANQMKTRGDEVTASPVSSRGPRHAVGGSRC
jgi:hypothetical protein